MPDFAKHQNGDTDWTKFFLSIATAVIMVMQAYSQMQHNDTKEYINKMNKEIVPRHEVENTYINGRDVVMRNEMDEKLKEIQKEIDKITGVKGATK